MTRYSLRRLEDVLIPAARNQANPVEALRELYTESGEDGIVAEALGEEHERLGDLKSALHWYGEAEAQYWDEHYKQGARESAARIRALMGDAKTNAPPQPLPERPPGRHETLYVVSCTWSKVWDDAIGNANPFVPAALAYTGGSLRTWRQSQPGRAGARWLILSAKYGFIEPDHPIGNYDVTFSDPSSGPVDDATLFAQAAHQTRWADSVPLRDFTHVVVIGSREYLERTRRAFEPFGARVEAWTDDPPTPRVEPRVDADAPVATRAEALGQALGELPAGVYEAADRREPEWPVLERIAALPAGLDVLLTLALALSDYQLGPGGATVYWAEADRLLDGHAVESSDDMLPFMEALMTRPVAARLAQAKVDRVGRLLASKIAGQVADGVAAVDAGALWENLANALGGDRNAKTIVFALKTLGLLHLRATGRRMRLPDELPIPVDLRIARVSLSAGLIAPPAGVDVVAAMENVGQIAADMRGPIIDAWREVAQHIGLTAPEFDSLLWQIAVPLHSHRRSRPESTRAVSALLEQRGAESAGAQRVADELTWGLATQAAPRSESSVSGD